MSRSPKDERDRSRGAARRPEGPVHNLGFDDYPARAPDHIAGTPDWPGDGFQRPDDVHLAADLFSHHGDPAVVRETAAEGVAGIPEGFPFREELERALGQPVLAKAHTGPKAAAAARSMGARAFATGSDVAFRDKPDLHTAAHEAAHTLQQASGAEVAGGVGRAGDDHERTADRAADLVVAGKSASHLFAQRGPAAAPTTAVQMQKDDGAGAAQDSASVVDQMLPLFGKSPAKWARFIKGLHSIDAKKQLLQAIINNPALGRPVGFGILRATIGTLGDVRDDFGEVGKWALDPHDHRLAKAAYKNVLKPAYKAVIEPAVEVAEEKARPFTDPVGTAQDIGHAVAAAYEKDGLQGVLAMPSVAATHAIQAFGAAMETGDVRAIYKLILGLGIDVAAGAAIGRVLEGVMVEARLASASRKTASLARGAAAEAEVASTSAGSGSGTPGKFAPETVKAAEPPAGVVGEGANAPEAPAARTTSPEAPRSQPGEAASPSPGPAEPAPAAVEASAPKSTTAPSGSAGPVEEASQGSAPRSSAGPEATKAGDTSPSPRRPNKQMRVEAAKNEKIDEFMRSLGRDPKPNPEEGGAGKGRQSDRLINGVRVEYKKVKKGSANTIRHSVKDSIKGGGQARHIVIDARGTGLTREQALEGIKLAMKESRGLVDVLEIIGDGFFERN